MPQVAINLKPDDWFQAYAEKLKHPKWQRKRLKIFERDGWRCRRCRDTETMLQVHHKKYTPGLDPWLEHDSNLLTLCITCHDKVTAQKRRSSR